MSPCTSIILPKPHSSSRSGYPYSPRIPTWQQQQRTNLSTPRNASRRSSRPRWGRTSCSASASRSCWRIMAAVWMWSQQPDYRVLFANFSDRDGGAITASLDQMAIPYKFSEGGSAILVPAEQVHDARLKLAVAGPAERRQRRLRADGKPEAGRVPVPRTGQLPALARRRTGALDPVAGRGQLGARAPGAAEAVGVRARAAKADRLGAAQPAAGPRARHRPRSAPSSTWSPPACRNCRSSNVTVVDQNGNLLSETGKPAGAKQLDPNQLKYVDRRSSSASSSRSSR